MKYDVLVIGAGFSGLIAAVTAADRNKKVAVIAEGKGNLYVATGFIDFLGYYPRMDTKPLKETIWALRELISKEPEHPYAIAGEKTIHDAFTYFNNIMRAIGYPYYGSWEKNRLLPTAVGAIAPTAIVPPTAKPILETYSKMLIAGFQEQGDFFPFLVAENLKEEIRQFNLPINIEAKELELGVNITSKEINSFDVALLLEKKDIRTRVIAQLKNVIKPGTLLVIPAILGVHRWEEVMSSFETNLNCPVMEIPTLPPSVMGYRLAEGLLSYLQRKHVDFYWNCEIKKVDIGFEECRGLTAVAVNGRELNFQAKNYILATGGILGGGIKLGIKEAKERVFNLPVRGDIGVHDIDFFAKQPYVFTGLKVTPLLQPKDYQGRIVFRNVFITGRNLYGYDPFVEKSGNGVALVTGYLAGVLAARG